MIKLPFRTIRNQADLFGVKQGCRLRLSACVSYYANDDVDFLCWSESRHASVSSALRITQEALLERSAT